MTRGPREAARLDPAGFLEGLPGPVVIDEVQRVPGLLLAIKDRVDRDTRPGRFLLTGSANVFASRRVHEALTGRMETIVLWPLAQAEIRGAETNIIDLLFAGSAPDVQGAPVGRAAFASIVAAGGYPEAMLRPAGRRRNRWFANYTQDALDTDLRDISDALKLVELPRLLRLIAAQAANELVYRNLARRLDLLTHATVKSYVELLEIVFLARRLPAWRPGIGTREVRAPKGYIVDSGLLAYLLGADERRIGEDDQITGKVLENFVAMELLRLSEWADTDTRLYHYRQGREEIDLILESRAGDIAAIEVKAAATLRPRDYTAITKLRDARGEHFKAGIVVYAGHQTVPLGDRMWAVPVSGLWA
jgi:predicted AAA+ superfamily ATPase